MKILKKLLLLAALVVSFASCSDKIMDKINENTNDPSDVPSRFIITDVIVNNVMSLGADIAIYSSIYTEHETGTFNQMYSAEIRNAEVTSSSTYNNSWVSLYANINAANKVIEKCEEGGDEAGNNSTLAMSQIMKAYTLAMLTDMWGDVPYSESFDPMNNKQPKLDKQKDIYTEILSLLSKSIENIDKNDTYPKANETKPQDLLYAQNKEAWKRLANGLLARYTMRLSNVSPDYEAVLGYIEKSFKSSDQEAKLTIFDGIGIENPYVTFFRSRVGYLGFSQSFYDKMSERNDPRLDELIDASAYYCGDEIAPNGTPDQDQGRYAISTKSTDGAAPVYLLSYHELLFLKAEALLRLDPAANKAEAEIVLKDAIATSMDKTISTSMYFWEKTSLTKAVIDTYFKDEVKPLFEANALKEVAVQKYFALYGNGESTESYCDYRRNLAAGDNFITLANPKTNRFPLRFTYGGSDVTANTNVREAYGDGTYVLNSPVWWAGGTR